MCAVRAFHSTTESCSITDGVVLNTAAPRMTVPTMRIPRMILSHGRIACGGSRSYTGMVDRRRKVQQGGIVDDGSRGTRYTMRET